MHQKSDSSFIAQPISNSNCTRKPYTHAGARARGTGNHKHRKIRTRTISIERRIKPILESQTPPYIAKSVLHVGLQALMRYTRLSKSPRYRKDE